MTGLLKAATAKPRRLSKADKMALNVAAQRQLIQEIEEIEQRAHRLGMHVTAGALNRAKNALGWETIGDVKRAGEAARDQRPER